MDSDHITAFAKHFEDQSFDLRLGQGAGRQGATLSLSFFPEERSMSMGAYDYQRAAYTHNFGTVSAGAVAPFIAEVEAAYGIEVPAIFRSLSEEYLSNLNGALGLSEYLEKDSTDCEYCGPSNDSIDAFYYPPIHEGEPASLGVNYSYGCYGGEAIHGNPEEVGDSAIAILESAIEHCGGQDAEKKAGYFLRDLKMVLKR